MAWANYIFNSLGDKTDQLTRLAPSMDAEIKERINASTSSYTTKLTVDTFRPGIVFKSFCYQAKAPISNRVLLATFLMLWLKRCVIPILPLEVIVADVVYPAVLLAFSQNIALLLAMVGCIQIGLQILMKLFCKVEVLVDDEGNVLIGQNGDPKIKVPKTRVELPYTYLVAWYVMHYPSLMTVM